MNRKQRWKKCILPFIGLFLFSCVVSRSDTVMPPLTSTSTKIYANTNPSFLGEFGVFSIATSNFFRREFIDEWGNKRDEETAALYVMIFHQPDTYKIFDGYAGLSIYYYSYKIHILRLGYDKDGLFTEIDVTNAKSSDSFISLVLPKEKTVDYQGSAGLLHFHTDNYRSTHLEQATKPIPTANATLTMWAGDNQEASVSEKIHIGQTLLYEGCRIHITRIDSGSSGWFTIIELGPEEPPMEGSEEG
jgi:hypothetical protein